MEGDTSQIVAIVGLGRMGGAIARRIAGAGFPVLLWNRDTSKAEAVAADTGGRVTGTAADAASQADFILTSLADDEAVESVYLSANGILSGITGGCVAIDTSTIDPSTVISVGERVDSVGGHFLDCPVSGSVATVEAGALTVMAGGTHDLVTRVGPILAPIAKRVIRVGDRGSGAVCKLAVNALVHSLNVALAESLVLAEKAGVDRAIAYEVFSSGAAGAPFVHYKQDAYLNPEEASVAFSLDLVAKDLELITGLGDRIGVPMAQTKAGFDVVRDAIESGMGSKDMSAIAQLLRGEHP